MNAELRDNLNALVPATHAISTARTTTSTTYADPTGDSGPLVTVATLTAATLIITAHLQNNAANTAVYAAVVVSGATSRAAADAEALIMTASTINAHYANSRVVRMTGLTPGMNTFTMKYKVSGGTGTVTDRELQVVAAG